jgi:hypothetical protein
VGLVKRDTKRSARQYMNRIGDFSFAVCCLLPLLNIACSPTKISLSGSQTVLRRL